MSMNRRHFLKHVAGYSALALPAIAFARNLQANAQQLRRNNKSLIIMWMQGGPATIDIWDLKPGRPTGGPFREINTRAQGVKISEHMPRTADVFDKLVAIRSLTTTEGDHMRGRQLMHTSYTPNPAIAFPSIGAVMSHEAPKVAGYRDISLPGYISLGGAADGPGFLGMNYSAFTVQNPGTPPQNIRAPGDLGSGLELEDRVRRRQRLFYEVENRFMYSQAPHLTAAIPEEDRAQREAERAKFADGTKAHRDVYYKGFSLVASKEGQVFDLKGESAKTQEEYGAAGVGATNFGRAALLARRLVEAGVSSVELSHGSFDTHNANFDALSTRLLPPVDKAIGALVKDLVDRGRWQDTVILWMGEFARTPRINQNVGRDHWARCWSIMVGGGAIKGGQAFGSTDADGMAVADNPVKIGDVFATVYRALGIDPNTQVRDAIGRPFAIAGGGGRPIETLF
jgi:hypothetical protein